MSGTAATSGSVMQGAKQPTGAGAVGGVGPVLAVLLLALGLLLLHDALAVAGAVHGVWIRSALAAVDGLRPQWWLALGGVVVLLVGLWLVVTALRPRTRKAVAVTASTGVFVRTQDLARLASAVAEQVDGVVAATSVAGRRRVTTRVRATDATGRSRDGGPDLRGQVEQAVVERLAFLDRPPTVRVAVRGTRAAAATGAEA